MLSATYHVKSHEHDHATDNLIGSGNHKSPKISRMTIVSQAFPQNEIICLFRPPYL